MSASRLASATVKEFRQFFRDPVILILVLWLYTIEIVICAFALTFDLRDEPIGVLDRDRSQASRAIAERFDNTSSFRLAYHPRNEREAAGLLDGGRARFVLVIPEDYGADRLRGAAPEIQILVDGANSMTATTALGIARRLLAATAIEELETGRAVAAVDHADTDATASIASASTAAASTVPPLPAGSSPTTIQGPTAGVMASSYEAVSEPRWKTPSARAFASDLSGQHLTAEGSIAARAPLIENRIRLWYNPDLRFVYFVVISMIALAAYMVGVIHPTATIVKEKESGTIEQVLVTPLGTGELILAKTLPTLIIGLLDLGPALLIARAFGVPFRGDLLSFALLSTVFLISAIGTGILVATWTRTLQQALLVAFFILFPVMFLSGTMTPIETMPESLQLLSRLSPLRYYMEALLAVFLKGVGLKVLWPQLLWMLGLGVVLMGASVVSFRRKVALG